MYREVLNNSICAAYTALSQIKGVLHMPAEDTRVQVPHNIIMQNRSKLSISGVEDVENFDDREVVLYTSRGKLTVHGTELHIERLSVDEGDLTIEGRLIPSNTPRKCAAGAVSSPSCSDDHPDRRTNDGAVYPVCLRCARRHIFRYIICCPAVVRQARRRLFMGRVVRYPIPDRRHHVFPDRLQRLPASFSSFWLCIGRRFDVLYCSDAQEARAGLKRRTNEKEKISSHT